VCLIFVLDILYFSDYLPSHEYTLTWWEGSVPRGYSHKKNGVFQVSKNFRIWMIVLDKFSDTWVKLFSLCKNSTTGKLTYPTLTDLLENVRTAAGSSPRAFASGVPFKLSDSNYSPRDYSVLFECFTRVSCARGCQPYSERRRRSGRGIRHRRSNLAVNIIFYLYNICILLLNLFFSSFILML